MAKLPDKIKQISVVHSHLINSVVAACQNSKYLDFLEIELKKAEANGWIELIKRIRKILNGSRKTNLLIGLDEEDAAIVLSILVGLQNPKELPKLNQVDKSQFAPESLSKLLIAYKNKDSQAIELLNQMITQMKQSDGDMKMMGKVIEKLSKNDLNIDNIKKEMSEQGKKLVDDLLNLVR